MKTQVLKRQIYSLLQKSHILHALCFITVLLLFFLGTVTAYLISSISIVSTDYWSHISRVNKVKTPVSHCPIFCQEGLKQSRPPNKFSNPDKQG